MDIPETQDDLLDELVTQYIDGCRQGTPPDSESYIEQHPEHAVTISELFPMIAALESMKQSSHRETARTATQLPLDLKELGDFELIREIGRGGMGIVYEARQRSLGRRVALKILPRQSLLDPAQLKRFRREARIVAQLHHTNVVSLFGAGEHQGYHFLAMELVSGHSLARLIKFLKEGRTNSIDNLPDSVKQYGTQQYWREVARIGRDAALGLQHAHERDVLHRDLTPSNLLLEEHGNVMLTDFGMAKRVSPNDNTRTLSLGGTLGYVPPECFSGRFSERSDVFGIGVILYELLTLKPAFNDASPAEAIKRVAENSFQPTPPSSINASIPRDLETIVQKAVAEQPSQRYGSAKQLADDLERFLEHRSVKARRISSLAHAWRWCGRNRCVVGLSTLTTCSLIAISIIMTYSSIQERNAKQAAKAALAREMEQRERSDATVSVATNVLDNIYEALIPTDLQSFDTPAIDAEKNHSSGALPVLSDEMVSVMDKLLEFYDQLADRGGDNRALLLSSAMALGRVGDIYCQIGQPDKALKNYNGALKRIEELETRFSGNVDSKIQCARLYNAIGRLYHMDDCLDQAIDSHRQALAMLETAEDPQSDQNAKLLYEMARTHYFMGRQRIHEASHIAMIELGNGRRGPSIDHPPEPISGLGRPDHSHLEAETQEPQKEYRHVHLRSAIEILRTLSNDDRTRPEHQFLLACCTREFSDPREQVDPADTNQSVDKAIELLDDLVERFPKNAHYRYELAETLRLNDGMSPGRESATPRTMEILKLALRHADILVTQHPNEPQYAMTRMHVLHRTGHVLLNQARSNDLKPGEETKLIKKAVSSLSKAETQTKVLLERWPNQSNYRLWTIVVQGSLAKALLKLDKKIEALVCLKRASDLLNELEPLKKENPQFDRQLPAVRSTLDNLVRFTKGSDAR